MRLLELREQTLEVVPISYVLSSEGFLLYCYHQTYELIKFSKIQDARCLSETYEHPLMPYEEYKSKR